MALLVLGSGISYADVYKYVDGAGHVYYTDKPRHSGFRLIIHTPVAFSRSAPSGALASAHSRYSSRIFEKNRQQYTPLVEAAADRYRLDPALLHAVIQAESAYNPGAVSNKGAAGLMQLMPGTAERFGVRDRFDPVENIDGGARYLSALLGMFRSDVRLAVAAYNSGENTVRRFGNQIPPIAETQDYVDRVLNYYRR
ncbi:lytic transglycosylase domain-containing protein [Methylococcus sp. EFPC2]|uniref:lytic transglycosylase domain-containing protein n=1 Tax=Methylococcus sp. EFPC2 TaxID=2812648 RepID=UPI00196845CE|nr:lytic transglycosylase domain-containing protein [Methylococcus sp. EFPC2]QSA95586.1 lytic transglycosylase domain-containing protein [Methylococcus sp. EFPC2]